MDDINRFTIEGLSTSESFIKIDNEISRLGSQLRYLCSLRNTLPPITKLPNEILSRIFLRCRDVDPDADEDTRYEFRLTRLRISWVSRWWREVALSDPVLWSFITFPSPYKDFSSDSIAEADAKYFHACIERSGDVDLSLSLYTPPKEFLEVIFEHLHRIREIDIDIVRGLLLEYEDYWKQPAPRLISLTISRQGFIDEKDQNGSSIFGQNFPNLHHLILRECDFRFSFPLISAPELTTLHIIKPGLKIPLRDFAQGVCLLPSLRDLLLKDCFEASILSSDVPAPRPKLETIVIEDAAKIVLWLLRYLYVSSAASVNLTVKEQVQNESQLREVFQLTRDHCEMVQFWGPGVDELAIQCGPTNEWIMVTASWKSRQLCVIAVSQRNGLASPCDPSLCAYTLFPPGNLRNVSLARVSPKAIYELNKLSSPVILKLDGLGNIRIGPTDTLRDLLTTPGLYPSVTDLKVDGRFYLNFREFQDSL